MRPVKLADGMRCEWHNVRAYAKEKEIVIQIILQDLPQAIQVFGNGLDEPIQRIGCETKGMAGGAAQTQGDDRIADLHDF
jgi:hypothetical protein